MNLEWSLDYDSYFNVDFIIKYKSKDFNRILDLLDLLVECQSNFLSKNMSIQFIPKKTSNPPVTRDGLLDFNIRIGISG